MGAGEEELEEEEGEAQLRVVLSACEVPNVRPAGDPVGGRGPPVTLQRHPG